jgi:hypothetical protein
MSLLVLTNVPPNGIRNPQRTRNPTALAIETAMQNLSGVPQQIRFTVPSTSVSQNRILLQIFDLSGNLRRTLFDGIKTTGTYCIPFDLHDNSSSKLGYGNYFCRLRVGKVDTSILFVVQQ